MEKYNVCEGSVVHMVTRLRGDIGAWTGSDAADPLVQFLLLTDKEREEAKNTNSALWPDSACLQQAMRRLNANMSASFERRLAEQHGLLSAQQRGRAVRFLDRVWQQALEGNSQLQQEQKRLTDLKVAFDSEAAVEELLCGGGRSSDDAQFNRHAVQQLLALRAPTTHTSKDLIQSDSDSNSDSDSDNSESGNTASAVPAHSKIVLRLTRAPVDGCIAFHLDQGVATVAQVALNDESEYEGGRLCFVTGSASAADLTVVRRPAGCLTIHPFDIMHAVTKLHAGSRYSLFVLDAQAELEEGHIVTANRAMVRQLMMAS